MLFYFSVVIIPIITCCRIYKLKNMKYFPNETKADILLVCDSINTCGVTRKYKEIYRVLKEKKYNVIRLDTSNFNNYKIMPIWNNLQLILPTPNNFFLIKKFMTINNPTYVHILTEGPLGLLMVMFCVFNNIEYSTMFCTRVDKYVEENIHKIFGIIFRWYYYYFHKNSKCIITPSKSMIDIVYNITKHPNIKGILNGCNTEDFRHYGPGNKEMNNLKGPIWLYVGRLCKSKGIQDLLDISYLLPGTIVLVGEGPLYKYRNNYKSIKFLGWKTKEELNKCYRSADVFVFPSKTDTFGQVMVEAMLCGIPVASYNVIGPKDVVINGVTGVLNDNLYEACIKAYINSDPFKCINHARSFTWDKMVDEFIEVINLSNLKNKLD